VDGDFLRLTKEGKSQNLGERATQVASQTIYNVMGVRCVSGGKGRREPDRLPSKEKGDVYISPVPWGGERVSGQE